MTNVSAQEAKKKFDSYADFCVKFNSVVNVSRASGNIVILSEEDYLGLIATRELERAGMVDIILEGKNSAREECVRSDWDLQ